MSMAGGRPSKKAKAKKAEKEKDLIESFVKKSSSAEQPLPVEPKRRPGRPRKRREPQFRTTVDMPESMHERLEEVAFYERRSLREIMLEAIQSWLLEYDSQALESEAG